jgi:hypothetical protein
VIFNLYLTSTADSVQPPNDNEATKPNDRHPHLTAPPTLGESVHKRRASNKQENEQKHKRVRSWIWASVHLSPSMMYDGALVSVLSGARTLTSWYPWREQQEGHLGHKSRRW